MLKLYELKMYFFYLDDPEEFMLFVWNFNINLVATWTLDIDAKIQYICMIFRGEALRQFNLLSGDVENT